MTSLDVLKEQVSECRRCADLCETRTKTVFGVGPVPARLMFIGEAPGADEDKEGEPFVGTAGKLLNNIIAACGWRREEIYIANTLKCRPPKNRRPTPEETKNCRGYLDAQIAAVGPRWIVCWGATAGVSLLGKGAGATDLRGKVFDHAGARVVVTYHPAYLLPHRRPDKKQEVWEDLQVVIRDLRESHENR